MVNKRICERKHFKRRLFERYGLLVNREEVNEMVRMIQNNNSECIEQQSLRKSLHKVVFRDREILVVYDKMRKTLVTALV